MNGPRLWRIAKILMFAVILVIAILRFLHLDADFPRGATWSGVLNTDEGWWCYGGICHYLTGQWHMEGVFDPMINQPLFAFMQGLTYDVFGMSLSSARGLVALWSLLLLGVSYLWVRQHSDATVALISVFLLSASFTLFVFSRLALPEIPLTCLATASLLLATWPRRAHPLVRAALSALLFSLALLTKSSAVFALPVLLFVTWIDRTTMKQRTTSCACIVLVSFCLWLTYYLIVNRLCPEDYSTYVKDIISPTMSLSPAALCVNAIRTVWNGRATDLLMYPLLLALTPLCLIFSAAMRRNRFVWVSLVWILMAGLVNVPRGYLPPRYYLTMMVPLTALFALIGVSLYRACQNRHWGNLVVAAVVLVALVNVARIGRSMLNLEYTFMDMARDVAKRAESDGRLSPVVLGEVAPNLSLATGFVSVNSMFGTRDLAWKVDKHRPDYYISVGERANHLETLRKTHEVELLATYDVFHSFFQGKRMLLYRLTREATAN